MEDDRRSDPSAPARHPDVTHSRLTDGQAVLLHLESGEYHELNPVGAAIWSLLDGERGVDEIAGDLRDRVEDPPDDLAAVVRDFLGELRERDLVT